MATNKEIKETLAATIEELILGHKDGEFIDSELVKIHKDWEVKLLKDISTDRNKFRNPISKILYYSTGK
jgi:hypothetical protein